MEVLVRDPHGQPVSGAVLELAGDAPPARKVQTDDAGRAVFTGLKPSHYVLSVAKEGFEPVSNHAIELPAGGLLLELALTNIATRTDSVEVRGTVIAVEDPTSEPNRLPPQKAKELPNRPATVADALPLTPGVVREPGGGLILSSSPENRSALIVNSADVTDPATGQFGSTIPIDSVEILNVYQTAYLAEYGRFTAGLVSVETKRGGDKWKWELNDPLPEFFIRSYHLRGLRTATPRLNFDGPLIKDRLFLSEGFEYAVRKTPIYTLPFPYNRKKQAGLNSFTQLDWVASAKHLVTATVHVAPERLGFLNLDFFNPEPVSPDAKTHNYTGTAIDRYTLHGGLLESRFSVTNFDSAVWGRGTGAMIIGPAGNSGSYFAEQHRFAQRISGASSYSFAPLDRLGSHHFKVGGYSAWSDHTGDRFSHTIEIVNAEGAEMVRVSFPRPTHSFEVDDIEKSFFGQDHWIITPRFAVDMGLRTEAQQISGAFRVAPRIGLAWTPFSGLGTVIRGGAGLFYDRVPLNVYGFNRYPNREVTFYDGQGNVSLGPFLFLNTLGQNRVRFPFVSQRPVDGNFSPRSQVWSIQLEHPVTRYLRLRATFLSNISDGLVTLVRVPPDPETNLGAYLLQGTGQSRYRQFDVMAQLKLRTDRELFASYTQSRARGDLNDFGKFLGTVPVPVIPENAYGTLSADLPHRLLAWGVFRLTKTIQAAPVIEYRSGFPYSELTASQQYYGIPNSHRYPHFLSIDSRISKDIKINAKYSVRVSLASFNLTNHFNPEAVHPNVADPAFGYFFGHRGRRFTADFDFLF